MNFKLKTTAIFFILATNFITASCSTQQNYAENANKNFLTELTYVTEKKSNSIQAFPAQKTWAGNPNMLYNALSPNGKILLATSPSDSTVTAFDTKTGKQIAVIKVEKAPKGIKFSPDGKLAYSSNEGAKSLSVIDIKTLKVIDTIKVTGAPHNARFTNDGKIAYVTLQSGEGIGIIDTVTQKQVSVIPTPGIIAPHNLDLSKDEKTIYVRDFIQNMGILDLTTNKITKIFKVGKSHGGIDVAPNGKYVSTGAIQDTFISVIDTKTLQQTNIEVGNGPHGIRSSADSKWIYVTITKDNTLVVVNAKTMKVVKTIPVGKFPFWVALQGNY
jgi:YVTN family beta-propeller protein